MFGNRFVKWVKILLKNQESCLINGGNTTKYFKFEKDTTQPAFTCSKLTMETLEQGVKYVQS